MSEAKKPGLMERFAGIYNAGNKIWIIFALFAMGLLVMQAIQGANERDVYQQIENFPCRQTPDNDLERNNTDPLQTLIEITSINLERDTRAESLNKNDILPINSPRFADYAELDKCLNDEELVVIVKDGDTVKIYPHRQLSHHLTINDILNRKPILITYCGFCNTYAVYSRTYKGQELNFGNTSILYKNNNLIYDDKTESLWSQFTGEALAGNLTGATLTPVDFELSTYGKAKTKYPNAGVLSFDTGWRRNYIIDVYEGFAESDVILGPILNRKSDLEPKQLVLGFQLDKKPVALAAALITEDENYTGKFRKHAIKAEQDSGIYKLFIDNKPIEFKTSYWYVWYDFFPETTTIKQ